MILVSDVGLLDKALHIKENERGDVDGALAGSAGVSFDLPDLSDLDLSDGGGLFLEAEKSSPDDDLLSESEPSFSDEPAVEAGSVTGEHNDFKTAEPTAGGDVPESDELVLTDDIADEPAEDIPFVSEAPQPDAEVGSVLDELDGFEVSEPEAAGADAESDEPVFSDERTAALDAENPSVPEETLSPNDSPASETSFPDVTDFSDALDIPELIISDDDLLPEPDIPASAPANTPAFTLSDDADTLVIPDEAAVPALENPAADVPPERETKPSPSSSAEEVPSSVPDYERSAVLWDAAREIVKSSSPADFFNVLILLVMGHLESSAASVIVPLKGDEQNKWVLRESRGTRIGSKTITFKTSDRIMNEILTSDGIVDIEKFADDLSCRAEYSLFLSIDARLAVPFSSDGQALAVLVLGEKLSGAPYSPSDITFAADLCGLSSAVYARVVQSSRLTEENAALLRKGVEESDTESFEKRFCASGNDADISVLIQDRLRTYGIDSYAFFTRTEQGESFYPKFTEAEDLITLRSTDFRIAATGEFCEHLLHADEWEEFENPGTSEIIRKLFGDTLILKMNIFIAHPFVIKGHLAGFMLVLRARREVLSANTLYAPLFCRMVSRYVLSCESVYVDDARFVDSVSRVFRRLERVIDYAAQLRIPVAAVVFSVRNIKRYCALYGAAEGEDLVGRFRAVIESRLSSSEFAVRTDRGKILVLLPGKNKKYAVPFANAVRNELASTCRERESQIMLTFMTGEYPADGKNIHELLDYLD